MSLTKRQLETQHDRLAEPVSGSLAETLSDVAYVSRVLQAIKNPGELDSETLCDLCVCLFNSERRLTGMLEAERRAS